MVKDIVTHDCDGLRHYTTEFLKRTSITLNNGATAVLPFGKWYELFITERNDNMISVSLKAYTFTDTVNGQMYSGECRWLLDANELPFETCVEFAHEFIKAYRGEKNMIDKLINRRKTK